MELWSKVLFLTVSAGLVYADSYSKVFQAHQDANAILVRPKRANSHLFEEIMQGNLERECMEERCNYEEARECFEDDAKTKDFWMTYFDGNQCESNPCQHGAKCIDRIGYYICNCTEMYGGINCETDVSQCNSDGPLSCDHFCQPSLSSFKCSCAAGYQIDKDGRACIPKGQYPCGTAPLQETSEQSGGKSGPGMYLCEQGHCQWQVTLINTTGQGFCSGIILGQHSVLTTASCAFKDPDFLVTTRRPSPSGRPSPRLVDSVQGGETTGQILSVAKVSVHERYASHQLRDDLAFVQLRGHVEFSPTMYRACLPEKDFSENVLMRAEEQGLLGDAKGARIFPYLSAELCQTSLNLTVPLTNKMFCLGRDDVGCGLLPGTPIVSMRRGTAFLTGLLISAQECDCRGHAFIKLSRYLPWIQRHLDKTEK